jgi:hypothetical protein
VVVLELGLILELELELELEQLQQNMVQHKVQQFDKEHRYRQYQLAF